MTYCVGMLTDHGLVLITDTRTNAGIDNISVYRKLHVAVEGPDRVIVIASAGSLSVTQWMLAMLDEGLAPKDLEHPARKLSNVTTMFQAAQLIGDAVIMARQAVDQALSGSTVSSSVSLLVGGRIGNGPLKLYLVYQQGNFIECSPDSPFQQIGELKYGKPILDRMLTADTSLSEMVKIGLLSFDAALRSNLSVGRPLDLMAIPNDPAAAITHYRVETEDAYYDAMSHNWGRLLAEARHAIPNPPFMSETNS